MAAKEFHLPKNALQSDSVEVTDVIKEADSVPKVKAKQFASLIWDHFTKIFENPGDKRYVHSVCNYCKNVKYANTTATTTLWAHLNKCKNYPYNKFLYNQKTIESFQLYWGLYGFLEI